MQVETLVKVRVSLEYITGSRNVELYNKVRLTSMSFIYLLPKYYAQIVKNLMDSMKEHIIKSLVSFYPFFYASA